MSVEIILSWLWQMGLVGLFVLVGYLYKDRKSYRAMRESVRTKTPLLPDRLGRLRKRTSPAFPQRYRTSSFLNF